MARFDYSCIHECGDEDCGKCTVRGIIFSCPADCPDYDDGKKEVNDERKN